MRSVGDDGSATMRQVSVTICGVPVMMAVGDDMRGVGGDMPEQRTALADNASTYMNSRSASSP